MSYKLALVVLTGAMVAASCTEEPQPAAPQVVQIVRPTALPCPMPDPDRACMADTHALQADFDKAMAGDYQAQRNTAYLLSGASPYVVAQPIQACAWRQVISTNRPADAPYTDGPQLEIDCGKLSAEDRAVADHVAALISTQLAS